MPTPNHLALSAFGLKAIKGLGAAAAHVESYSGMCDGSTAVALDADHFVVADDDNNRLHIFRRGKPDNVGSLDLVTFLESPKRKKPGPNGEVLFKEADIESAARIGERIFWIASHGRDSGGEEEPTRARFFATDILSGPNGPPRLQPVGEAAYKGLRDAILAEAKFVSLGLREAYGEGETGPAPESENGFNIEGLAATKDGRLLIGFRNPRPGGKALLVPLTNANDVVEAGKAPTFGGAILLDLGGRGVRSIESIGDDRVIIVAGPHGKAADSVLKPPFALYAWGGDAAGGVTPMAGMPEFADGFAPEAILAMPGGNEIMLLSDDGDRKDGAGVKCKDQPEANKCFRAMTLTMAAA